MAEVSFFPDDISQRRGILVEALRNARNRWYALTLERRSRELSLEAAKKGSVKAKTYVASAADQMKTLQENQLAQVHLNLQQLENEIRIYQGELESLPEEPAPDEAGS